VSTRARTYAREILAQAGAAVDVDQSRSDDGAPDAGSSLLTWLAIGGAIVVAWVLMDD
jgi:hypothetical protein